MIRLIFYTVLLVLSSGCTAEASQAQYEAMVITTVSNSEVFSQYKAARGIPNEVKLISTEVDAIDPEDSFYAELGINYMVVYTYQWGDDLCTIGMPIKTDKGHVTSIGDGFSNSGCGE